MPKIRTIKPEFWTDGAMVGLSPFARLLFIGTWNFTLCDAGHLPDDLVRLKLQILPMDNVDIEALMQELLDAKRISRIHVGDRSYLHIVRFTDHQRIESRWASRCPACAQLGIETSPNPAEPRASSRELAATHTNSRKEGKGREGKGVEGAASRRSPETPLPDDWQPTESHRKYATENRIDVDRQAFLFRNHAIANDRRQRQWNAAFTTWLGRSQDFGPARPPARAANDQRPEGW